MKVREEEAEISVNFRAFLSRDGTYLAVEEWAESSGSGK